MRVKYEVFLERAHLAFLTTKYFLLSNEFIIGCGKCGDVSCGEGALTKSQDALKDAKDAEELLKNKYLEAEEALNKINSVHNSVTKAADQAQTAFDMANDAKSR